MEKDKKTKKDHFEREKKDQKGLKKDYFETKKKTQKYGGKNKEIGGKTILRQIKKRTKKD